MGDIIKNNEGYLKIGFPTMRGTYMLPITLPIFHERYPNVRIDVHEANSEHLVRCSWMETSIWHSSAIWIRNRDWPPR